MIGGGAIGYLTTKLGGGGKTGGGKTGEDPELLSREKEKILNKASLTTKTRSIFLPLILPMKKERAV